MEEIMLTFDAKKTRYGTISLVQQDEFHSMIIDQRSVITLILSQLDTRVTVMRYGISSEKI